MPGGRDQVAAGERAQEVAGTGVVRMAHVSRDTAMGARTQNARIVECLSVSEEGLERGVIKRRLHVYA